MKVAWSLSVAPHGPGRSVLVTETRAVATDDATRRRYLAIWRVIAPFAGLLRHEVLRAVRAQAEATRVRGRQAQVKARGEPMSPHSSA